MFIISKKLTVLIQPKILGSYFNLAKLFKDATSTNLYFSKQMI